MRGRERYGRDEVVGGTCKRDSGSARRRLVTSSARTTRCLLRCSMVTRSPRNASSKRSRSRRFPLIHACTLRNLHRGGLKSSGISGPLQQSNNSPEEPDRGASAISGQGKIRAGDANATTTADQCSQQQGCNASQDLKQGSSQERRELSMRKARLLCSGIWV